MSIEKAIECKKNAMELREVNHFSAATLYKESGGYFNEAGKYEDAGEMYDLAAWYFSKAGEKHFAVMTLILAINSFSKVNEMLYRLHDCYLSVIHIYLGMGKTKKVAKYAEEYANLLAMHGGEKLSLAITYYEMAYKYYKLLEHPAYASICKQKAVKAIHDYRALK